MTRWLKYSSLFILAIVAVTACQKGDDSQKIQPPVPAGPPPPPPGLTCNVCNQGANSYAHYAGWFNDLDAGRVQAILSRATNTYGFWWSAPDYTGLGAIEIYSSGGNYQIAMTFGAYSNPMAFTLSGVASFAIINSNLGSQLTYYSPAAGRFDIITKNARLDQSPSGFNLNVNLSSTHFGSATMTLLPY